MKQINCKIANISFYPSFLTFVLGAQKYRLIEMVLLKRQSFGVPITDVLVEKLEKKIHTSIEA